MDRKHQTPIHHPSQQTTKEVRLSQQKEKVHANRKLASPRPTSPSNRESLYS